MMIKAGTLIKEISKNVQVDSRKNKVMSFLVLNPFDTTVCEMKGDKNMTAKQPPPVTIPISVLVNPLYCKKTATYPIKAQDAAQ